MPPTQLIIVCCHGLYVGGPAPPYDEKSWLIAPFQSGEEPTFVEHIRAGVQRVADNVDKSVLMFSGGPTRKETELSEARTYLRAAQAHSFWGQSVPTSSILLEERALDSYHNILFSLTLFYSSFTAWPSRVTIISHDFKRPRLLDSHCRAIGYPLEQVEFIGIDPQSMRDRNNKAAWQGVATAMRDWEADPHGRGSKLTGKRSGRNPFNVWQGIFVEEFQGRKASGLVTIGHGKDEILDTEASRPW
ncbi:uncharacterized protein F5Z01DRAFT_555879 [Emericellopsis atlantica]|uniref:DUF218 domain-containing protein n=1 Tax=Emericellopsis atlantica TaxID=2614577 RepID=A0A9P8CSG4_9HYPO|nr:uncharacterized protein F5Z01DRAFT_555879 [Emericellopsis atlantica]KAG9255721.1 hypothetical protein F5Z01DRAFT_555879 [Emericellopsis atlantica]